MDTRKAGKRQSPRLAMTQGMAAVICQLIVSMTLASCEKEIEIDYHDMKPMYVVEGSVSNLNASVRVSRTLPVMGADKDSETVTDATVVLVTGDSIRETLPYRSDGYYRSPTRAKAGTNYRLEVTVGNQLFTSTSVMQRQPVMNSMRFVWKKIFGRRILFADLRLQDLPDETNYYYLHLFRNGVPYRSAVMRDRSNPGGELQQLFSLCTDDDLNSGDRTAKETLYEGDVLSLEIRSIDSSAYDYLFSLLSMNNSGTNPIANFEGGCLGYFSAFHQIVYNFTYNNADSEEE